MITKFLMSLLLIGTLANAFAGGAGVVNVDKKGVALQGYDAVAFFTEHKPVKGVPEFKAVEEGATYYFASKEHLATFSAKPAQYLPVYGGYCAYGVAQGAKVKVEIDTWQIVNGRLYLNYDQGVKTKFNKDVAGYIAKADAAWPKVSVSK